MHPDIQVEPGNPVQCMAPCCGNESMVLVPSGPLWLEQRRQWTLKKILVIFFPRTSPRNDSSLSRSLESAGQTACQRALSERQLGGYFLVERFLPSSGQWCGTVLTWLRLEEHSHSQEHPTRPRSIKTSTLLPGLGQLDESVRRDTPDVIFSCITM